MPGTVPFALRIALHRRETWDAICLAVVPIVLIRWQPSVSRIKKCSFYVIIEERLASSLQETKGLCLYELLV